MTTEPEPKALKLAKDALSAIEAASGTAEVINRIKAALQELQAIASKNPEVCFSITDISEPKAQAGDSSGSISQPLRSFPFLRDKDSRRQILYSFVVFVVAEAWLWADPINAWLVAHFGGVRIPADLMFYVTILAVFGIDFFLVCLLNAVIQNCENKSNVKWPKIPYRWPALLVLIFQFFALILAFARINKTIGLTESTRDSLYESFLTVATWEHGHYHLGGGLSQLAVVGELLSVMLLLFVFFPLLVSRLAMFQGETISPLNFVIRLHGENTINWKVQGGSGVPQLKEAETVDVELDAVGNVKSVKPANASKDSANR